MNFFEFQNDSKRYHTLNYFYQQRFGSKVFKIPLNGNFSCPNINKEKGLHGCIYCTNNGSAAFKDAQKKPLVEQFNEGKKILHQKWPDAKYIVYFQANTNTYAPLNILKEKYESVLNQDNVIGINIATRSDALSLEILNYLEELSKKTFLTIELGLQSCHDKTLDFIKRGHDVVSFTEAVKNLRKRKINVVVHIINGLPNEDKKMMLETIKYVNKLNIQGIKIHMLHVLKDTELGELYLKKPWPILTKEEYIDIVCDQIEILNPQIVVNRITGDPILEDLIEPTWLVKKFVVLNDIDKELRRRNTYQGFKNNILNETKRISSEILKDNDLVIDATIGNGNDALWLLKLISKGHLFGFDIQDEAIIKTKDLLNKNNFTNYTLIKENHRYLYESLNNYEAKISLIIFNLGYLPKGNKDIKTNYKDVECGIEGGLKLLNKKGIILITVYPGHNEGKIEKNNIINYLNKNSYSYQIYRNTDNKDAPFLLKIKKP